MGPAQSAADVQRIGPRVIASEQRGLADLRSLRPPVSLRADWQRLLADLTTLSANANRLLAASRANDTATAQQIANASTQVQAEITSVAGRDGLTDCAKG